MNVRWLSEDEVLNLANPILRQRGWAELNTTVSRVLGAFCDEVLVEFFTIQLFPMLGPMIRTDNTLRDNGSTSRALAQKMEEYLQEEQARGWMVIAESPVTERLCERHSMTRLQHPVFVQRAEF